MKAPALVLDSTFLWHLYGIPRKDGAVDEERRRRERQKLAAAIQLKCLLFVPYPIIFETANSIAHVRADALRRRLAEAFVRDVETSIQESTPWLIVPRPHKIRPLLDQAEILDLCKSFRDEYAQHRIGLSDMVVLQEAGRLQSKYREERRRVYIWTADAWLKEREPDKEPKGWLPLPPASAVS